MTSKLRAFRPPPDIVDALLAAQSATGTNTSQLIIRSIRRGLPTVVRELVAERQSALNVFENTLMLNESPPAYFGKAKRKKP